MYFEIGFWHTLGSDRDIFIAKAFNRIVRGISS